ncbi:hypothetical protein FPV67DRAFT_1490193 [Lyophyllum atratum]|nr:hypothetical protein FPV67DRAFT_1490193 [Lyophyllum atratum]
MAPAGCLWSQPLLHLLPHSTLIPYHPLIIVTGTLEPRLAVRRWSAPNSTVLQDAVADHRQLFRSPCGRPTSTHIRLYFISVC